MLKEPLNLADRKPIWKCFSAFYLDTELQESDFQGIAETIIKSPYSFEEVKVIDKYEIFPVLQSNLLQVAGEWAGFEEDWLLGEITATLQNTSKLRIFRIEIYYWLFRWMHKDYWRRLEEYLLMNPSS
jgi:hypothetical protein